MGLLGTNESGRSDSITGLLQNRIQFGDAENISFGNPFINSLISFLPIGLMLGLIFLFKKR